MYVPLTQYKGRRASDLAAADFATLDEAKLDARLVESAGVFYLFIESRHRIRAVKLIDVDAHQIDITEKNMPVIPPDPDNVLSNYSWSWLRQQPDDVQKQLLAAQTSASRYEAQGSLF